jgi:hypothetical protein
MQFFECGKDEIRGQKDGKTRVPAAAGELHSAHVNAVPTDAVFR